ncbi:MAG: hypothetical protein JRD93_15440 [Deltaproteobacteria bacterium]|nr:hypothetical protein [Deltaproteobacteria bacterium]
MEESILDIILKSLKEITEFSNNNVSCELDQGSVIFGPGGLLDSMGLVTLITDLEEKLEDEFGVSLILADERAMSQKKTPFRTVSSLAQYINTLMQEEKTE